MTKKNDIIGLWRFTYKALVNVAKSHRNIKTSFDAYDVITKKMSMRHDFDLEDSVAVIIVSNVNSKVTTRDKNSVDLNVTIDGYAHLNIKVGDTEEANVKGVISHLTKELLRKANSKLLIDKHSQSVTFLMRSSYDYSLPAKR